MNERSIGAPRLPDGRPNYAYLDLGEWWTRPGMGHCGAGIDFHSMGLAHGKGSAFAKRLAGAVKPPDAKTHSLPSKPADAATGLQTPGNRIGEI